MRKAVNMAVIAAAALLAMGGAASGNSVMVKSISIRGLKYMTKAEALEGAGLKGVPGGMILDLDSLRDALAKNRFIGRFDAEVSGGGLILVVEERVPERLVLLKRGEEQLTLETDAAGTIISVNRIHRPMSPLYIIGEKDVAKGAISSRVKGMFELMNKMKKICPALYGEIESVEAGSSAVIALRLKGRKTLFTLSPGIVQFVRIERLVGYLDRKGTHPALVALCGDKALVRQ